MPDELRNGPPARNSGRREPTHRLFFALWPDEAMQSELAGATQAIVAACDGTPVPPRNFHFTLAFLGAVPESRIADLTPVAARIALAFQACTSAPISVTLDHIEHWRKSEILCATSKSQPTAAIALAETLKGELTVQGFSPDLKPFRAHATLARKVRRVSRERDMPTVHWSFHDFRLVESRTAPTGSLYSSREIYPLDTLAR